MERRSKRDLKEVCLRTIGCVGILSMALFAPNALRLLKDLGLSRDENQARNSLQRSLYTLIKNNYVRKTAGGSYKLSKVGHARFMKLELKLFKLKNERIWDKKWRVVIFDIPERMKNRRRETRLILKKVGFVRLQDSVWIYPHDCREFIWLLRENFALRRYLLYLEVTSLEDDLRLRTYFDLR